MELHQVRVLARDAGTGALTPVEIVRDGVGGVGSISGTRDVVFSPEGLYAYVLSSRKLNAFSRNPVTGGLSLLQVTVPGIGPLTATMIYAWVGDVRRFPHAKQLAAYAGLVPTVRQSGGAVHVGGITKQGAPALRATLVQAAHVLLSRCRGPEATPLQAIGLRIRGTRGRRKIAVVAGARHLLRIAYYILREGTTYDAHRLGRMTDVA